MWVSWARGAGPGAGPSVRPYLRCSRTRAPGCQTRARERHVAALGRRGRRHAAAVAPRAAGAAGGAARRRRAALAAAAWLGRGGGSDAAWLLLLLVPMSVVLSVWGSCQGCREGHEAKASGRIEQNERRSNGVSCRRHRLRGYAFFTFDPTARESGVQAPQDPQSPRRFPSNPTPPEHRQAGGSIDVSSRAHRTRRLKTRSNGPSEDWTRLRHEVQARHARRSKLPSLLPSASYLIPPNPNPQPNHTHRQTDPSWRRPFAACREGGCCCGQSRCSWCSSWSRSPLRQPPQPHHRRPPAPMQQQ